MQQVSFCFATKTTHKLWLQVFCSLLIRTTQQLRRWPTHRISCCFPYKMIQQLRWRITPIPSFRLLSVSFCVAMKTTQKLWLQVSCSFASKTLQQLWRRLLPTSYFSWLLSHFPQEPKKPPFARILPSWLSMLFQLLREQQCFYTFLEIIRSTKPPNLLWCLKQSFFQWPLETNQMAASNFKSW